MTILTADDEPLFLTVLAEALQKMGHHVLSANDGAEAFELWKSQKTEVVITDWLMPNMTGIDLCKKIRSEKTNFYTYIILLTGLGSKRSVLEGFAAGVDDFIVKPFDEDQLMARLSVAQRIINLNKRVEQLEILLPVCSWCKKIRSTESRWMSLEDYIKEEKHARISHTICPDCAKKYF